MIIDCLDLGKDLVRGISRLLLAGNAPILSNHACSSRLIHRNIFQTIVKNIADTNGAIYRAVILYLFNKRKLNKRKFY